MKKLICIIFIAIIMLGIGKIFVDNVDHHGDTIQHGNTVADNDKTVADNDKAVADNDNTVADSGKAVADNDKAVADNNNTVADNDKAVADNDKAVADNDKTVADNDKTVADNDKAVADNDKTVADNNKAVADNNKAVADNDKAVADNDKAVADNDKAVADNDNTTTAHDSASSNLWDDIKGTPSPSALLLGLWTYHFMSPPGKYRYNNDLFGGIYRGFFAATLVNSYDRRSYIVGISRIVYNKDFDHSKFHLGVGYRLGLLYGYDERLMALAGEIPLVPIPSIFTCLRYAHFGVELSYTWTVVSAGFTYVF